jgi:amino acid adenylation domain-containing protein
MDTREKPAFEFSTTKRAALEALLREKGVRAPPPTCPNVPRRAAEGPAPLSFAQERLWFLHQLAPHGPVYNIPAALRLTGALDVAALERSLAEIVRRHEALRTTFAVADGQPVQVINPARSVPLPVTELCHLPEGQRQAEARRRTTEEARRAFDLEQGPLLRTTLLRLDDEEHLLLVLLHHIVADGWSLGVLVRELGALYPSCCAGRPSPLPPPPIQYADYAVWQRQWLQGAVLERQLAYWREQLRGLPSLDLPADRPRPAVLSFRGAAQSFDLPSELLAALQALCRRERVTLFMTLLAAFQALLGRYAGQDDVAVGTPVANRNRAELEGLIGFFVNTLVLRADLSGKPTFRALLGRVREAALGAYAHQDLPFERLVAGLRPQRDPGRNPLFQVMFALHNVPLTRLQLPGLTVSRLDTEEATSSFDLSVTLRETGEGLAGWCEYSTDLFDDATIRRLLGHYRRLLEGLVANPDQRLDDLPLLTEAERRQVLVDWNPAPAGRPPVRCLHQLFEEQAGRTPDAVAVTCGPQRLTYRALNRRANRLAHFLRRRGVGAEVPVAVCLERSAELVVALLAVLKAGGAYVPLDPAYPRERLALLLHDAQAPLLLTEERLVSNLPAQRPALICLDTDAADIVRESDRDPSSDVTPAGLAYVIYTSGSTGKPKGCLVSHANVVRLLQATAPWFHFDDRDVWALFHSYAFDFSVWEFWGALAHGGRLVVVPYGVSRSPQAFYGLLGRERVTVLNQTPSAFYQLMSAEENARADQPLSLRVVIFGGEALDLPRLRPWFARHGDRRPQLVNMYGITETTVHVTYRPLTAVDLSPTLGSPIGRPIPDLQTYLLDARLEPVPVGIPGELYVGGAGLGRGYLRSPDVTAERFLPNPFSTEPGARLYRSGDRARWLQDGSLEFLGRVDEQVKIRGFRIEPGEVEAALREHPGVHAAAVVARQDAPGDKRLVAYVVPRAGAAPPEGELRGLLQEKLPEHMRPAAYVFLEALPLTAHGKLDRQALPAPDPSRPALDTALVAPRSGLERWLADVWREVLGVNEVGIDDNLFALGGNSIQAALIGNKLQHLLGEPVSLAALFEGPTIARFARHLAEHYPDAVSSLGSSSVAAGPGRVNDPTALVPAEGAAALLARLDQLSDDQVDTLLSTMKPDETSHE